MKVSDCIISHRKDSWLWWWHHLHSPPQGSHILPAMQLARSMCGKTRDTLLTHFGLDHVLCAMLWPVKWDVYFGARSFKKYEFTPPLLLLFPLPQQQHVPILDWAMPSAYTSKGRTHMLPNPQSEGERQPTPSLSVMGGRNKCFSRSHEVMGMFISQPTQEKQTVGIFVSQHHQPKQTDTAANQPPS